MEGTTPTDKPGNYLTRTGHLYFLKKEGDDWTVHKHKSLASTSTLPQKFDKTNFKDRFPIVGEAITEKTSFGDDKDNWGFMSGDGDFENIQPSSDSDSTTQT